MAAGNRDNAGGPTAGSAQGEQGESSSRHALSGLHPNPIVARHMMNKVVQRRAERKQSEADAPERLEHAEASGGAALPEKLQKKFGGSLGADVSDVRVHTGSESGAAARSVSARAYTVGKNVHFADGQYQPESAAGEELLAHEVAHTVQQSDTPRYKLEVSQPGDPAEQEADQAAAKMVQGAPARVSPQAAAVGRKPHVDEKTQGEADALATELEEVINGASWEEIRKRVYPAASAENVKEAKERKQGARPDLTGLGKITTLEDFAASVKAMQPNWKSQKPDERMSAMGAAIDKELKANDIPELLSVIDTEKDIKGGFFRPLWEFQIGQKLLNSPDLDDATAADLCNTVAHESRHAEQAFLAARYAAGPEKKSVAEIHKEEHIPKEIAEKAAAKPIDGGTDAATADLGKEMFGSMVTHQASSSKVSKDWDKLQDQLKDVRGKAEKALTQLKDDPSRNHIHHAKHERDALKDKIEAIEKEYALYRALPHEKDAHVVGDAAEEAFKGWK